MAWGLALSGGGVLGAAHLGVLQALEDWGVRPDTLAGTSAGGVIAGVAAAGVPTHDMIEYGRRVCADPLHYFRPRTVSLLAELLPFDPLPPADSILDSTPFVAGAAALCRACARIADWTVPTAVTSVDVSAMEAVVFLRKGAEVAAPAGRWRIVEDAPLQVALQSTMALPGVYTVVQACGGLLVDGGVADNLPVDWAAALGADRVLAVDVAAPPSLPPGRPTILWTLWQSFLYAQSSLSQLRAPREVAVLTLVPRHPTGSIFGFGEFGRLVEVGFVEAARRKDEILSFICGADG